MKGTKRLRENGAWEHRVHIGRDKVTGKPRQKSRSFKGSERQADTALAKMVTEVAEGKHGGTNATVSDLLDAWLKDVSRTVSPATMAVYKDSVRSHLKPALGHMKVSKIGVQDLDTLYGAMRDAGKSVYVIRQAHSAIRAALELGFRWGWVPTNVGRIAKPPRLPEGM